MVTENSRWIPPDSPSLCTGREWALVICTFLHCKICTPRMRVCFPQRALGRQNSIFSLEIPSITITSSKPSSGLAFGQNLKPPPSYFWFITATMFIKQHSVIDVCLGTTLALFGHLLFYPQRVEDYEEQRSLSHMRKKKPEQNL